MGHIGDNQGTSDGLLRNSFLLYVECHLDHFFFIDCFRIISEGEEKEIVLKAENEEARDSWLKKVVSASVAFSQAKRKRKKEMNDKRRSSVGMATLEVHVIEAADLKGADITGKSDPFCVIKFANQEQSTQHIPQTCSPKWNEKFVFQVHNPQSDTLEITVFDKDIFSPNDFLGCAKLPLSKLLADGPGPWKKRILLEDVPKGEIELEINLVG
jgi:Ca2+-dependent lipid-binding protein